MTIRDPLSTIRTPCSAISSSLSTLSLSATIDRGRVRGDYGDRALPSRSVSKLTHTHVC